MKIRKVLWGIAILSGVLIDDKYKSGGFIGVKRDRLRAAGRNQAEGFVVCRQFSCEL